MEATIKVQSDELKSAVIKEVKERLGLEVIPSEATLHIKFDDVSKSVSYATLTVKKD